MSHEAELIFYPWTCWWMVF